MKQISQLVRGVLLAFVVFELLLWLGGRISPLAALLTAAALPTAAVVLLICLWLTFVRKSASAVAVDQQEYLITMQPGAYGCIGNVFDKSKYGTLKRLPGGFLAGVRTYRAEDGSLLFTVRQHFRPRGSVRRWVCATALTAVLLLPLSGLSHVLAVNARVGTFLSGLGVSVDTTVQDTLAGENYLLPSNTRELTESDVQGMDSAQIQRAINEMYARHGYDLSNCADAAYFSQQSWYKPDASVTQAEVRAEFSELENTNLNFLITCRSKLN